VAPTPAAAHITAAIATLKTGIRLALRRALRRSAMRSPLPQFDGMPT